VCHREAFLFIVWIKLGQTIRPDYDSIIPVGSPEWVMFTEHSDEVYVNRLKGKFPKVFREEHGVISGFEVNLRLKPDV
jgi:hypothetical protein